MDKRTYTRKAQGGWALSLVLGLLCSTAALAQTPATPAKPAQAAPQPLQFADIGNIVSWQPGGAHVLYIKSDKNQWYRVHIYEPCLKLYPNQTPTFDTETSQQTRVRESYVMFGRAQCTVTAITPSQTPPPAQ